MSFKAKYIVLYLIMWALMYACTSTWVWVRGSDRTVIHTSGSELDSIMLRHGIFADNNNMDTVVVKQRVIDSIK